MHLSEIERIARAHGTGGWQTLNDMLRFGQAIAQAENQRWEAYRAEIESMEERLGKLSRNFLDCGDWEGAAKCALKAEGLKFVKGRMPPKCIDHTVDADESAPKEKE